MESPLRILLVEDTQIAQMVAKAHMLASGCEVDIAEDGLKAIEHSLKIKYDLILMDIGLGEGPDGFEVTTQIKNNNSLNKNTPIIALTSHGDTEIREKATEVGMSFFICKPFSNENARQVIDFLIKSNN